MASETLPLQLHRNLASLEKALQSLKNIHAESLDAIEARLCAERDLRLKAELQSACFEDKAGAVVDSYEAIIGRLSTLTEFSELRQQGEYAASAAPSDAEGGGNAFSAVAATVEYEEGAKLVPTLVIERSAAAVTTTTATAGGTEGSQCSSPETDDLLVRREAQIKRLTAQLHATNEDCRKLQVALRSAVDKADRSAARCIELQVKLTRQKKLTAELEATRAQAVRTEQVFRSTLMATSASALPVSFATRAAGAADKAWVPAPETLAGLAAEVAASEARIARLLRETAADGGSAGAAPAAALSSQASDTGAADDDLLDTGAVLDQ